MPESSSGKGRIFVCYRRNDTDANVDLLVPSLKQRFGEARIFVDVDNIEAAENYRVAILSAVSSSEILIAMIGRSWLSSTDQQGRRRLAQLNDTVRMEIATALTHKIAVIPVLLHGTTMPDAEDLPDDLAELALINGVELSRKHCALDVDSLLVAMERILAKREEEARRAEAASQAERQRQEEQAKLRAAEDWRREEEARLRAAEKQRLQRLAEEAERRATEERANIKKERERKEAERAKQEAEAAKQAEAERLRREEKEQEERLRLNKEKLRLVTKEAEAEAARRAAEEQPPPEDQERKAAEERATFDRRKAEAERRAEKKRAQDLALKRAQQEAEQQRLEAEAEFARRQSEIEKSRKRDQWRRVVIACLIAAAAFAAVGPLGIFWIGPMFKQEPSPNPAPTPTPLTGPGAAGPGAGKGLSGGTSSFTNKYGIEMVYVPAGEFMMGDNNGNANEQPAHKVKISDGFYLGRYEVTQKQFQEVMSTTIRRQRALGIVAGAPFALAGEGDNYPAYYVSWNEAQAFVQKLNQLRDSYVYRLPTEAEWEYACRAGTTGDYAGNLDAMAWWGQNADGQTHPVGTKQPNEFGLYDMHGNVSEWCQDWSDADYYKNSPSVSIDPKGPASGKRRIMRGGSWYPTATCLQSRCRADSVPDTRDRITGFRVVAKKR